MLSSGFGRPPSKCQVERRGATGYTFGSKLSSNCHADSVSKRTYMAAGNSGQICAPVPVAIVALGTAAQPTTVPRQPRRIFRRRSMCSVANPTQRGKMPYKFPHSLSRRWSQKSFSLAKSGFALRALVLMRSVATAYKSACPWAAANWCARNKSTCPGHHGALRLPAHARRLA